MPHPFWMLGLSGALLGHQDRVWQAGPIPPPRPEAGSREVLIWAPPAQGIRHVPGVGQEWAEMLPFRWAQLGRAHDQVGQGCKEIETSPTVASLEQELEVLWG